jgi:hypothetical protein
LESTDRFGGFVSGKKKIETRISSYQQNNGGIEDQRYLHRMKIYHEIRPQQLCGLFYFNQAISLFHQNKLEASCQNLKNAWEIYDNPRIGEFVPILKQSIGQSHLDDKSKGDLIATLNAYPHRGQDFFATR